VSNVARNARESSNIGRLSGQSGHKEFASESLLNVGELGVLLQVKPSWIYSHADELGAFRLGKYLRFALPRVLERLEEGAACLSKFKPPTQRPSPTDTNKMDSNS
jgi:hypothetical protein